MDPLVQKIAIGTAQFGLDYGIANSAGKVCYSDVCQIFEIARGSGIATLDTAVAYGESESVLGKVGCKGFSIVSKLPEVPAGVKDVEEWVQQQVAESLIRLQVNQLDGLLLHRPEQLSGLSGKKLYAALRAVKSSGLVNRIGISIYDPSELNLLRCGFTFDLIQAPFSAFDQRLLSTGWLERLAELGTAVHLRSIFLQGLLLMRPEERPLKFLVWKDVFERWDSWLDETNQCPLNACLNYAFNLPSVEKVVLGVNSPGQLRQIISGLGNLVQGEYFVPKIGDDRLLNPVTWDLL